MRRAAGRVGLALGGLLLGLVVLELALRAGALVVQATGRELPRAWLTGNLRILCLGDSNTYGLYLERDEAYPAQLEALWNERVESPQVEVLNLGFPGTNSYRLRRDFERVLETFRPDRVIVLIGANDFWTMPVPLDAEEERKEGLLDGLRRGSRAYRLFDMIRRALDSRELEVGFEPRRSLDAQAGRARFGDEEFELGWVRAPKRRLTDRGYEWVLAQNIGFLADRARAAGVGFTLLTYASRFRAYETANRFIRNAAEKAGVRLLDLSEAFERHCPEEDCPELLFPDHHPTRRGYRLVAETLLCELRPDACAGPSPE